MELRFVPPALSELDSLDSEVLACTVWEDQRPCGGVAGLCDWRFAGGISRLLRNRFVSGAAGEVVMLPGRPRMSFDKVLLFGAGPASGFNEGRFREVMAHMMDVIVQLRSRVAVVQLPGRQQDQIPAERAADILLEQASTPAQLRHHDAWTLIEDGTARKRIQQHMIEERRRIRVFD